MNLIAPPLSAQSYGIKTLAFHDHFDSLNTIDLNATAANGFNWYSTLWTSFTNIQGTQTGILPADPTWFSESDSILTINNNQAYPSNGKELLISAWKGNDTWGGTVPLVDFSTPFYIECRIAVPVVTTQLYRPTVWMVDRGLFQNGIDGITTAYVGAEVDVFEFKTDGTVISSSYIWPSAIGAATASTSINVGAIDANYHRFGYMHIPMASNGGGGIGRWFLDGVPSRPDNTWSSGSSFSAIENSRSLILLSGIPNQNVLVDYVSLWTP